MPTMAMPSSTCCDGGVKAGASGSGAGAAAHWYHAYGYYRGYAYHPTELHTGFLRLKVRPRQAQVFVDGSFVGVVNEFDGVFQRLRLEEGPGPALEPEAVRIEVHAAGVNFADSLLLRGRYQVRPRPPFVPANSGLSAVSRGPLRIRRVSPASRPCW